MKITSFLGRHCCLFCETTKANMQLPEGRREKCKRRTLESLRKDLQAFIAAGNDIKNAKDFNNVIDEVIFNVELDQVNNF